MNESAAKLFGDGADRTRDRSWFLRVVRWSFVAEAGGQITTVLVGTVLAVIVGPEGYGVMAMALSYVLLVELVQRQGIVSAVIQRRHLDEAHASSAFWLVLATSAVLTAASVLLAGWWAEVNGVAELAQVIVVLSVLLPVKALVVVQEALLRRDLAFRRVALRTSVSVMVGGVAGVLFAWFEPTVWAFVVQQLVAALTAVVLLWSVTRWRPRLRFSTAAVRDLFGFSAGSVVGSLGVFVNNRSDVVLMGLFFGPAAVGVYAVCARLADAVIGLALRPLQSMSLPELSPFQHRHEVFRTRLYRLDRLAASLGLPVLGVLGACAVPLVLMLGPAWSGAAVPLQLLVAVSAVRVVTGLNGPVLQALGRPHLSAAVTWVMATASAVAIGVTAAAMQSASLPEQVIGIALARLLCIGTLGVALHIVLLRRLLGIPVRATLARHVPAATSAAAGFLSGSAIRTSTGLGDDLPALQLMVSGITAAGVAAVVLCILDRDLWSLMCRRVIGERPVPTAGPRRSGPDVQLGRHRSVPGRTRLGGSPGAGLRAARAGQAASKGRVAANLGDADRSDR